MNASFYVYVLKSRKNGKHYIGSTSKKPEIRCVEHNQGSNVWTKKNGPFELLYSEVYPTKREALKREKLLKSGVGRKFLKKLLGS